MVKAVFHLLTQYEGELVISKDAPWATPQAATAVHGQALASRNQNKMDFDLNRKTQLLVHICESWMAQSSFLYFMKSHTSQQ